jgi:hypothetical protein
MEDQDEIETTIVDEPLVRGSRNHALYCAYTIRLLCRHMPTIFPNCHTVFDHCIIVDMDTRALVQLNDDVHALLTPLRDPVEPMAIT